MCGIFGFVTGSNASMDAPSARRVIDRLFLLSESRGKESSGIAVKDPSSRTISVLKRSIPASELIRSSQFEQYFNRTIAANAGRENTAAIRKPLAVIAHARLVTDGSQENVDNNQPVVKDGCIVVHNGIVTNVHALWERRPDLTRRYEVDTEIIASLVRSGIRSGQSLEASVVDVFNQMEGAASIAFLFDDLAKLLVATNTGSFYYAHDLPAEIFFFASERYILHTLLEDVKYPQLPVTWLRPGSAMVIDLAACSTHPFSLKSDPFEPMKATFSAEHDAVVDYSPREEAPIPFALKSGIYRGHACDRERRLLEYNQEEISHLRRCTSCILPETFPFIEFDTEGVCNYCRHYVPKNQGGRIEELKEILAPYRSRNGEPDCIVAFSGGRDSSYGLHYIVTELNMQPLTFTYDWGMITDLARRNVARVCGKLGIENILVSADIAGKRENIQKNVSAWLKRPRLGMIPLFMAGDKHFFYYVNKIRKETGIGLNLWCSNPLENTDFKVGLCGIPPNFGKKRIDYLSTGDKIRLATYYLGNFLRTPAYVNSSLMDTATSFYSYYAEPRAEFHSLYEYLRWDENEINRSLRKEYNWELAPDTTTTWRIGDGTVAFYNYCYYTIAGFSEIDTFRSNQIREGALSREEGLRLAFVENRPRYESIRWYLDTIGIPFADAVSVINRTPKYYRQRAGAAR
jgi:glucosamine--fructose-6-phosphate aminotransferase (isomerizing)